ncbi:Actin cross-linking protein [Hirschfeldia incana]|nr:Actin cross-linking protein [Hirschfeldia incana]
MEFFHNAKAVRMRNVHEKYLVADEDEETVTQDRIGSDKRARWTVEPVRGSFEVIRLKSCYGNYLTASNERFLLGATGRKVVLSKPDRLGSFVEWEPVREGSKVKLRTRHGNFLRANGGLPPWRNSVTHDSPHSSDSFLWDVDLIEILVGTAPLALAPVTTPAPHRKPLSPPMSRTSSEKCVEELTESLPKSEGRVIYYHIADEEGHVEDESAVGYALTLKGNSVEELTQALREETSMDDVVVCTRNPSNGKLFPLRLQLPPNSGTMHVVLVPSTT